MREENDAFPTVLSTEETIEAVLRNNLSVVRVGDGEMLLMSGLSIQFQEFNLELAEALKKILRINVPGLMVCIPGIWNGLAPFKNGALSFVTNHLLQYGAAWTKAVNLDQVYGDAYMTRCYLGSTLGRAKSLDLFKKMFSRWRDEKVILIEGDKSRVGVGNDMFSNATSMERILCPAENAYSCYEKIKTMALESDKTKLILLSVGPVAKLLAVDLFLAGYRVIDIGHLDMEYEMCRLGHEECTPIRFKYFGEIGCINPEDCNEPSYLSEIISRID